MEGYRQATEELHVIWYNKDWARGVPRGCGHREGRAGKAAKGS